MFPFYKVGVLSCGGNDICISCFLVFSLKINRIKDYKYKSKNKYSFNIQKLLIYADMLTCCEPGR